jgi:SAM-dependent methyltransferase
VTELYERHAALYDLAFGWDVEDEIVWLLARLGPECSSVLEPGCGSGRVLEALARRGVEAVGLDRSEAMVELARTRLGASAEVVLADMTDFDLGRVFDGAVCPINTLGHLSSLELTQHLEQMGRHLRPGARYLVQLQLGGELRSSRWETGTLRVTWTTERFDAEAGRQQQRSRLEILSGERAGEVVEELHELTLWTPEAWAAAVAASPFVATAVFDGSQDSYPAVEAGTEGPLLWHELARRG